MRIWEAVDVPHAEATWEKVSTAAVDGPDRPSGSKQCVAETHVENGLATGGRECPVTFDGRRAVPIGRLVLLHAMVGHVRHRIEVVVHRLVGWEGMPSHFR